MSVVNIFPTRSSAAALTAKLSAAANKSGAGASLGSELPNRSSGMLLFVMQLEARTMSPSSRLGSKAPAVPIRMIVSTPKKRNNSVM